VSDDDVLDRLRTHWSDEVDAVEHLPVGFGAYHWVASVKGRPTHFVTLDSYDTRQGAGHDAASLESTYAAVSGLMFALDFVVAPVPTHGATYTVPLGPGPMSRVLSVTPWISGSSPERLDLEVVSDMLRRLHAVTPPTALRSWAPLTGTSLPDDLADLVRRPWSEGPYGERARSAIRDRLPAIAQWSEAYHGLAELARRRSWVLTHGEPGEHNLMVSAHRTLLVDWETAMHAPAERDWRTLVERGLPAEGLDAAMLDLFDIEWRLDEIDQYAGWFSSPHSGNASDRIAMGGLLHELTRAPFQSSANRRSAPDSVTRAAD
jgi:spectinomycin phosphotransferase